MLDSSMLDPTNLTDALPVLPDVATEALNSTVALLRDRALEVCTNNPVAAVGLTVAAVAIPTVLFFRKEINNFFCPPSSPAKHAEGKNGKEVLQKDVKLEGKIETPAKRGPGRPKKVIDAVDAVDAGKEQAVTPKNGAGRSRAKSIGK